MAQATGCSSRGLIKRDRSRLRPRATLDVAAEPELCGPSGVSNMRVHDLVVQVVRSASCRMSFDWE
jgi:hypothetical protein